MSTQPQAPLETRIVVTDLDIPFGRLVAFFIKAGLAAIPAAIVLWIVGMAIAAGLATLFGGWGFMMHRWAL